MRSADPGAGAPVIGDYETFDGQRLAYWQWTAENPRATLVYVHGIESHGEWFDDTARLLAAGGVTVYAPDRRGSGHNWLGRGHCRAYEHLLVDILLFLQHIADDSPVHLLGLSWGGKVAFAFAQRFPERLASVILVTPGIWPRVTLERRAQWDVLWRWVCNSSRRMPVPLGVPLFSDQPTVRHRIESDPQRLLAVTPAFFWESRRLDRAVQGATSCALPLRVILSGPDRIVDTPHTEQWVAQLTTPSTHTTIHDTGHAIQLEHPALLADELRAWVGAVAA